MWWHPSTRGTLCDDPSDVLFGNDNLVRQDPRGVTRNLEAGKADEADDDECRQRVEDGKAVGRPDERGNDRYRRQDVALRVPGVGEQQLARQPLRGFALRANDCEVDEERAEHDREARGGDGWCAARAESEKRRLRHLDDDDQQEQRDTAGRQGLEFAVAVGMIRVRRLLCEAQADERHDVRRAVGERMKPVGKDADGAADLAKDDLRQRDAEVQAEDADEDLRTSVIATQFALERCRLKTTTSNLSIYQSANLPIVRLRTHAQWV